MVCSRYSSKDNVRHAAESFKEKLAAIENSLIRVEYKGASDRLDLAAMLNSKLA
jgi:hypothetical protein